MGALFHKIRCQLRISTCILAWIHITWVVSLFLASAFTLELHFIEEKKLLSFKIIYLLLFVVYIYSYLLKQVVKTSQDLAKNVEYIAKTTRTIYSNSHRGRGKGPPKVTDYDTIDFSNNKTNSQGEFHNFKIASWNVGGLRAWMRKGGFEYIDHENPDVMCLQETKCNQHQRPLEVQEVENYHSYWCDSERKGYAGVAVFTKVKPQSVRCGIGISEYDKEGRCLTVEYEQFYIVCVYVPNSGQGLKTLAKRLKWNNKFDAFIAELDYRKPVLICGDMNVAHLNIDLEDPLNHQYHSGFTFYERRGMTKFLSRGFVDTFRMLYPTRTQAYTYWSYYWRLRNANMGWRIDYFIVSERYKYRICDNVIRSEVVGSDHCPMVLFLNV